METPTKSPAATDVGARSRGGTPVIPFDSARLDELMDDAGIDALLVTSKHLVARTGPAGIKGPGGVGERHLSCPRMSGVSFRARSGMDQAAGAARELHSLRRAKEMP
jgi:hypothetical protein